MQKNKTSPLSQTIYKNKLPKIKEEKLLKATREKGQITYKGTPNSGFAETLQARRE